jgi:SAM-dependent methyltransferase
MVTVPWYSLVIFAGVGFTSYFIFASFLYGAGYQPAPPRVVHRMLELARVGPSDEVYDLGAGTGGLLFQAVEVLGARGTGVEVEPIRYLYLRYRRRRSPARDRIRILRKDLFRVDLASATVVLAFLWPGAMRRLKEKLKRELRPGTRVVSYYHRIQGWRTVEEDAPLRVYVYAIPPIEEPEEAPRRSGPLGLAPGTVPLELKTTSPEGIAAGAGRPAPR